MIKIPLLDIPNFTPQSLSKYTQLSLFPINKHRGQFLCICCEYVHHKNECFSKRLVWPYFPNVMAEFPPLNTSKCL